MDIIEDKLEVINTLKESLLDENFERPKENKSRIKNLILGLSKLLFLEEGNPKLKSLLNESSRIIELLNSIKGKELSPELKKLINKRIKQIIETTIQWLRITKTKIEEIKPGNEHLKDLPSNKDPKRFYVMVKELNLQRHILKHPINEIQLKSQMSRNNERLIEYTKDPIEGYRQFSKSDSTKYPGSTIVIKNGHHRCFEIYRRYLQGRIEGNKLIEFRIKY